MTEWKLFDGDTPHVSTFDFHKDRERAPHLEQPVHYGRLMKAAEFARGCSPDSRFVDLGCGDGGLLSVVRNHFRWPVRGYDFQPSNIAGWAERGLNDACVAMDFVENWAEVYPADVYAITECLEHLKDPHEMLRRISARGGNVIASSPYTETYESHDECHAWAWDMAGYSQMVHTAGFTVVRHETVDMFQVIWGVPR